MGKIKLRSIDQPIAREVLIAVAFASAVIPHTPEQEREAGLSQQARTNDGE